MRDPWHWEPECCSGQKIMLNVGEKAPSCPVLWSQPRRLVSCSLFWNLDCPLFGRLKRRGVVKGGPGGILAVLGLRMLLHRQRSLPGMTSTLYLAPGSRGFKGLLSAALGVGVRRFKAFGVEGCFSAFKFRCQKLCRSSVFILKYFSP